MDGALVGQGGVGDGVGRGVWRGRIWLSTGGDLGGKESRGWGGAENSSVSPVSVLRKVGRPGKSVSRTARQIQFLNMLEMMGTGRAAIIQWLQSQTELQCLGGILKYTYPPC